MAARKLREIPQDLAQARDRFEAWRRTRATKSRIPDRLWSVAVKLVGKYGLSRTASTLRLDYYSLKNRSETNDDAQSDRVSPSFIEISPPVAAVRECVIELREVIASPGVTIRPTNSRPSSDPEQMRIHSSTRTTRLAIAL